MIRQQGIGSWLLCWACVLSACQSLATSRLDSSSSLAIVNRITDSTQLVETIRAGRIYQHPNFLTESEIQWLLKDMDRLQQAGSFKRSGLSDTSRGAQQGFGHQDRSVSAVPWWLDALQGEKNNIDTSNIVGPLIAKELRHFLAEALGRPTMKQDDLAHECYYSISGPESSLPRHMDDKHEDLKGAKGWLLPCRRSLSWLIYLSEPTDWTLEQNGGALQGFPPRQVAFKREPTHEGNLQIAWLHNRPHGSWPVYLDTWFRNEPSKAPHAVLYTVGGENNDERTFLTQPWLNDNLPPNLLTMDFLKQMAAHDATADDPVLFLKPSDARDFHLIEDRALWDRGHEPVASTVQDVSPLRGSLVIFDSLLLPHQVEKVKQGQRIALAGWFHETTQDFPEDFYGNPDEL